MYTFEDGLLVVNNAADIESYCMQNDIPITQFNLPVKIADGITSCRNLFLGCESFNQYIVIPKTVTDCSDMFYNCRSFNQPVVLPPFLKSAERMFAYCFSFNQYIELPQTLSNCRGMFATCVTFNQYVLLPKAALLNQIFYDCKKLNKQIPLPEPGRISDLPIQGLIEMYGTMFKGCSGKLDLHTLIYIPSTNS